MRASVLAALWMLAGQPGAGLAAEQTRAGPDRPATPATPTVRLEMGWLVAVEGSEQPRLVKGARPQHAVEALFSLRFRYEGITPAEGLRIVQAVPPGMRYSEGSATGPGTEIRFSTDGGQSFAPAESLTVTVTEGEERLSRPAVAADYSHIRWDLPGRYPPGMGGLVSFRARPAGQLADGTGAVDSPGL